jgi:hypothetical protein
LATLLRVVRNNDRRSKSGIEWESDKRIWLRFHNNSKWQVGACMWDVPKEYGDKNIIYEVERYEKARDNKTPLTVRGENGCPRVFIRPGESVLFSIPGEHLANGLAIKVLFRYEWESDPSGYSNPLEPKHYAYFYSSDIPKK